MPIYESQRKSHALSQVRGIQSNEQRFEAPIGGLNTLDSIDNVPSTDAIILDNLIPSPGAVRVRGGFVEYADLSESGDVKTLIQYHDQDKRHFLAICTDSIFDIILLFKCEKNI